MDSCRYLIYHLPLPPHGIASYIEDMVGGIIYSSNICIVSSCWCPILWVTLLSSLVLVLWQGRDGTHDEQGDKGERRLIQYCVCFSSYFLLVFLLCLK